MFAILETGGKQYKVAEGDILEVELLPEELVKKNSASLTTVLLVQGDKDLLIGDPYVKNAKVKAKVLEEIKGDKIHIFKCKPKKGYQQIPGTPAEAPPHPDRKDRDQGQPRPRRRNNGS